MNQYSKIYIPVDNDGKNNPHFKLVTSDGNSRTILKEETDVVVLTKAEYDGIIDRVPLHGYREYHPSHDSII